MSLADPFPTIPIPSRERQIDDAVTEATARVGLAMVIECGSVQAFGVAIKEQREAVATNFRGATRRTLQKYDVLDGDGNVIPGQETHAQRHGFGKER